MVAESFERIHRSNLIGMEVLPLQFIDGVDRNSLDISGEERITISGMQGGLQPGDKLKLLITGNDGSTVAINVLCRIDTSDEFGYF